MSDPVDHHASDPPGRAEDDLARVLPAPPPPRPSARAATIAMALDRFDGAAAPSSKRRPAAPSPRPAWWRTGGTQLGALASIALVATIVLPLALKHPSDRIDAPATAVPVANDSAATAPGGRSRSGVVATAKPVPPAPTEPASPAGAAPSRSSRRDTGSAEAMDVASSVPAPLPMAVAPPPAPPAPAPPAEAPAAAESLADTSGAFQRAPSAEKDAAVDIVVTGSRISRRAQAASRRGDWNACTVADTNQTRRGCARPGKGTAEDEIAQGVALGWQEDWRGATQAFDRAIALKPRLGSAYLNRGLAHERLGNSDQALADLDDAVRYERSARSYFARARLRRARGDVRGARADEGRAVEMDSDYVDLVRD